MIIGVGFKKRVGKDSFYQLVHKFLPNRKVFRLAFADPLKNEIFKLVLEPNGLSYDLLDDEETKDILRILVNWYGTDFKRNPKFGGKPNHWVDIILNQIQEILAEYPDAIIIITDMRYPNEVEAIEALGGFKVHVIRDEVDDPNLTHSSQTILDSHPVDFDYTIDNNGTFEEYALKVEDVIKDILEKAT